MSIPENRSAIQNELDSTPEHDDFKFERAVRDGPLRCITLQPGYDYAEDQYAAQLMLDDSFDGASAWWGGPEDDPIILKDASAAAFTLKTLRELPPFDLVVFDAAFLRRKAAGA